MIQTTDTCRGKKLEWPRKIVSLDTFAAFEKALSQILIQPGPWVLVVKTDSSKAPGRPPKSPGYIKNQFIEELKNGLDFNLEL